MAIDREVVNSWAQKNAPELLGNWDGLVKLYQKKVLKERIIPVVNYFAPLSTIKEAPENIPVSLKLRKLEVVSERNFIVCKVCGRKNCEEHKDAGTIQRKVAQIEVLDSSGEIRLTYFYDVGSDDDKKINDENQDYMFVSGTKVKARDGASYEFRAKRILFIDGLLYRAIDDIVSFFTLNCNPQKEIMEKSWQEFIAKHGYELLLAGKEEYFVQKKENGILVANIYAV